MKELKYNYLDLEERIMECWSIVDELKLLSSTVLNNGLSDDSITNVLNGLEVLYSLKFNRLWECNDEVVMSLVRENKFLNEECKALREQLADHVDVGIEGRSSMFGVTQKEFNDLTVKPKAAKMKASK